MDRDDDTHVTQLSHEDSVNLAECMAHLLIGANPYLDISITHKMVMEMFAGGMDNETAQRCGAEIAKAARITHFGDSWERGTH